MNVVENYQNSNELNSTKIQNNGIYLENFQNNSNIFKNQKENKRLELLKLLETAKTDENGNYILYNILLMINISYE